MSHPDNMAVDGEGRTLPFSPDEVQAIVQRALKEGHVLAAVMQVDGDLMVHVFGPPSAEVLHAFETVTQAYRRVLEGH